MKTMNLVTMTTLATIIAGQTLLGGCSTHTPPVTTGPGLEIRVAPLELPGIGYACYDVRIENDVGQRVWERGQPDVAHSAGDATTLCSTRFGNGPGGAISYVGPCDATDANPDDNGVALHRVTLWLDGLYTASGLPLGDYQNPCPAPGGCNLMASCSENADTPVVFNLTVMRNANQGFFDVGVNFDNIFCSAKLDCRDAFLHRGAVRAETAVVAFACTSGQGSVDGPVPPTSLYLSDLKLRCGDGVAATETVLAAGVENGQQGAMAPHVFEWAQYADTEALAGVNKCAWNHAIGLDMASIGASRCVLSASGTASSGPFPGDAIPPDAFYPVIRWEVAVTDAGGLCAEQKLNAPGSEVVTDYVRPGESSPAFKARFDCGSAPIRLAAPVLPFMGNAVVAWERLVDDAGREYWLVRIDGEPSEPFYMEPGWTPTGAAFGG